MTASYVPAVTPLRRRGPRLHSLGGGIVSVNLPVACLAWSERELGPGAGSDAGPRPGGVDSESHHPKAARGQALGDSTLPLGCNARAPRLARRTRPRSRLGASAPSWALARAPAPGRPSDCPGSGQVEHRATAHSACRRSARAAAQTDSGARADCE